MKILTIIIPSYNTECYINECLPYFLDKQILNDIEIIYAESFPQNDIGFAIMNRLQKAADYKIIRV